MSLGSLEITVTVDDDVLHLNALSDDQNALVFDIVFQKAKSLTHNLDAANELTSDVLERLNRKNPTVRPEKLEQFLCKVTRNVYVDQIRHREAAHRKFQHFSIDDLDWAELAGADVLNPALFAPSASTELFDRQHRIEISLAFSLVMHSLPEQKRRLMEMTVDGFTNEQIANALGYASANVVAVTLHRIKRDLRHKFAADFAHLFTTSQAA